MGAAVDIGGRFFENEAGEIFGEFHQKYEKNGGNATCCR
jgi:hypothetical protein